MEFNHMTARMSQHSEMIRQLVQDVSSEQARWKPAPDSWSILEVINHLYDEEREDFRVRLDIILHKPEEAWPGIDPEGWVTERKYNERDLEESLGNYLDERRKSIVWLQQLEAPDWSAVYKTPFGEMTAGDMFAAWVSHDLLHLRQLVELHWAYTTQQLHPYRTEYAGIW